MIELEQKFEIENIITRRRDVNVYEFQNSIIKMINDYSKYLTNNDIYAITSTHSVKMVNGEQILDTEIIIPISEERVLEETDIFKPKLKIANALHKRVEDVTKLQDALQEINNYLSSNEIQQITSGYLVQKNNYNGHEISIDIYVGLNPNYT